MSDTPFATGRCLCGDITFTIKTEPARMAQCHCEDCRRASGTGHMSLAFFPAEAVDIQGEFQEFASTADSGNINTRGFCPNCGSRLFGRNSARPGVIAVTAGVVDDSSWFSPHAIVYNKDKPIWDKMADDVPKFDAMPPAPK